MFCVGSSYLGFLTPPTHLPNYVFAMSITYDANSA